jgi:hypothetical protein
MPDLKKILLGIAMLILAALACGESGDPTPTSGHAVRKETPVSREVLPKGSRLLELDANSPEHDDYDRVMDHARELGAESIRLSVYWDDIETSPGVFDPDPNWLAIANSYYPAQGFQVSLVIAVLDTTEIRLPADLEGKPFDDPQVISRFGDLLEYIAAESPDLELASLAIGNEIDGVLGGDAGQWAAYIRFFEAAADHANRLWPDVPVGSKVMFSGLSGKSASHARELNAHADVVMTTYYPLAGDFTVHNPALVGEDFDRLAALYPEKEIHITEIGFPTSEVNDSSPELQAEFIREMFAAWDEHADRITLLSYSWLSDLPDSSVQELESYYGLSNRAFGEFLRTLGLRTYPGAGEDKPGYRTFREEAAARGW